MGQVYTWLPVGLLAAILMAASVHAELDRIRVHDTDHWFLDSLGRVRLFHGVNAVMKGFPWYPEFLLEQDDKIDDLAEWGLNMVRLGSMWTGAEPVEGEFNHTYMNQLTRIINNLGDRGIYTMLDMHQDCLSSYYPPSYDGVPPWLIESFPEHSEEYPWPLEDIEYWEEGYLTQGVSESFQHIYNDTEDALQKWARFWGFMAETYTGNPNVIGYEFINEPWVGDYLSHDQLRLPGVAGSVNLLPSYDVLNEAIRAQDQEGIVFYEPVIYGQLLHGDLIGSGFDRVPGGDQYINVSAYSYHAYCWPLELTDYDAPDEERQEALEKCINETDGLVYKFFDTQAKNVNQTGGASILTEYGLCKTFQDRIDIECETYMELCDDYLQSWVEWGYPWEWYDGNWDYIMGKIWYHVRPYAQATAGTPLYMDFDAETYLFNFRYSLNLAIDGPTEIFIPALRYPDGYGISVSDEMSWEVEDNVLYVLPSEDAHDGMEVVVEVIALEP